MRRLRDAVELLGIHVERRLFYCTSRGRLREIVEVVVALAEVAIVVEVQQAVEVRSWAVVLVADFARLDC